MRFDSNSNEYNLNYFDLRSVETSFLPLNGIKIGEVTQTQAIVWTRLTQTPDIRWDGIAWPQVESSVS